MQSASKVSGGIHVVWMNIEPSCDKIKLERNKDGGAFATAYTVTGTATSQHDTQPVAPGAFCYRAYCVKGTATSVASNEKCATL